MSYLVLARKYRPQKFDEVIGQEHITDLLTKAIETKRIAHAYLFCGPRGIGKTSCARILAKCLNCEKGPTVTPCNKCVNCQEIAKATSFDVLEIDGASNRGIDEIRALRENVKFAPSYGRYKIYIVDEVHMLTTEAFNALLKTLEEPPEHVKFIFATTAPNKVPSTIISRCQRFDFKRVSIKAISDILTEICKKEDLKIEEEALFAIAKAAQGGLRDALSILDQLSALSERKVVADDVYSMLGLVEVEYLFELVQAIGEKHCVKALEVLDKVIDKGKDLKQLFQDLLEHFRNLMIIKIGGKSLGKLVDAPIAVKEQLLKQVDYFELQDILKSIDTLLEAQESARVTDSLRMPLEIALAKLTYENKPTHVSAPVSVRPKPEPVAATVITHLKNQRGEIQVSGGVIPSSKPITKEAKSEMETLSQKNAAEKIVEHPIENTDVESEDTAIVLTVEKIKRLWDSLTHAVSREKMSVATYLQEGVPLEWINQKLTVGFVSKNKFQKESVEEKNCVKLVERIFSEKLKTTVYISYVLLSDAPQKSSDEPAIQNAIKTFGGKVVSRWHNE